MTITAQEVCIHAAPIAALLGMNVRPSCDEYDHPNGEVLVADESLRPDTAAALLLGLIVAKSGYIEMDDFGIAVLKTDIDAEKRGCDHFDPADDRLSTRFKAFCHAFARAHGLSPAPTTEDTP